MYTHLLFSLKVGRRRWHRIIMTATDSEEEIRGIYRGSESCVCSHTRAAAVTYWGAAIREGRHADGHGHAGAHLIGGGGERGRGGAPFLCFLSLEEVTPGPLDAANTVHEHKH